MPAIVDEGSGADMPGSAPAVAQVEDGKLRSMSDSIRNFVRAADPSRAHVVPMRHGNVVLAPNEVDAYRVDYLQEKSFRADFANVLIRLVACGARIDGEIADFKSKQNSAYLWKPHADALAYLVRTAQGINATSEKLAATAQQRGLADKANAITASMSKLMEKVHAATGLLSQIGSR